MKTKFIAIGLLTDRIDVVLCAGAQALDGRRLRVTLEQDASKWQQQLREAAKAVRDAVEELGAVGLPARVLYHGPGACCEYVAPRVRTSSEASSAAVLACADSLACPIDAAATRGLVVAFEKGDQQCRAHVIVAADGDDAVTAIAEMVDGAALRFLSAAPLDAVTMAGVAGSAIEAATDTVATLHVGEHRSFFAITGERRLNFARVISIGLNDLVVSLTRPIRMPGGQPLELSSEVARTLVHECGFPSRTQIVHAELNLLGTHVIPMLQPVLQRFMVELRQSLRFALPEDQRRNLTLRLIGPGSRTPGFTQIIADELGLKVEVDPTYREYDFRNPVSAGSELVEALSSRRALTELSLEPLAASRKRRQRQLQRWLWTGAAASLGMIGFDALRSHEQLEAVRKQAEALHVRAQGAEALKGATERLLAASAAMAKLENTIRSEVGAHVCLGALLQELARVTPPSVRLYDITCKPGGDSMLGSISGYALQTTDDAASGSRMLEAYMQQLAQSPLLSRLTLANVQSTMLQDAAAQSFDVSFDAVSVPREEPAGGRVTVVDAAEESSP